MSINVKKADKPFLKLDKLMRQISKVPTQDQVHDVRTNTRRVEATLEALQLDRKRKARRLLNALTPIRKKAGAVRDMDVLTGFAVTLSSDRDRQCLVTLLEHLGEERARSATRLVRAIAQRRKGARKRLKCCSALIEKHFDNQHARKRREWQDDATAMALHISGGLANWPKLSTHNLHSFRLKVKALRNVLQLSGEDSEFTNRLGEVKDAIGEWHDWTVLTAIGKDVISDSKDCTLVGKLKETSKRKFETALKSAQQLRTVYFDYGRINKKLNRKKIVKDAVLKASAKLAA